MKLLIFILCFLFGNSLFAQNVGIGTNQPTEILDVRGNVNISGTLKANGVVGSSGQLLSIANNGNLAWSDMSVYKNVKVFYNNGIGGQQSWTI